MTAANENIKEFKFSAANKKEAVKILAKYPRGRQKSAVMPLLWMAQEQCGGWLPHAALDYVAEYLGMPCIRVYEVATFYTMYNLKPVGEHLVQVCQTSPCWLRGSDQLEKVCQKKIGAPGKVTRDGKMSWMKVECLGGCVNAPVVQINDDYYEDLDPKSFEKIITGLKKGGRKPKDGSQTGRQFAAPKGKRTTLLKGKKRA